MNMKNYIKKNNQNPWKKPEEFDNESIVDICSLYARLFISIRDLKNNLKFPYSLFLTSNT